MAPSRCTTLLLACSAIGAPGGAQGPSYACDAVDAGSIEALICDDPDLSALDRELASVYATASHKAVDERPPVLQVEQRGWIDSLLKNALRGASRRWKRAKNAH